MSNTFNRENWAKNRAWKLHQKAIKAVVKIEGKLVPHPVLKNTWIVVK